MDCVLAPVKHFTCAAFSAAFSLCLRSATSRALLARSSGVTAARTQSSKSVGFTPSESHLVESFQADLLDSVAATSSEVEALRSKCRSIAACSRGNLWRDIERLLGVPLAERRSELLRERHAVRSEGPSGTVSSGCQARAGDAGTERWERRERDHVPSSQSESQSDIMLMLREGVAGQLKLNSRGIVSEVERRGVVVLGSSARRPRCSFSFLISLTCCRLAAIRNCSISSVLRIRLELERLLRCEIRELRESQLLSMRERAVPGTLRSMSELIESQLSLSLCVRRGVTMQQNRALPDPNAERAGDADAFLEWDRDKDRGAEKSGPGVPGPRKLPCHTPCEPLEPRCCDKLRGRCAVLRSGPCGTVNFLLGVRPRPLLTEDPQSEARSISEQTLRAGVLQWLRAGVVQRLRAGVVHRLCEGVLEQLKLNSCGTVRARGFTVLLT